MEVEDLADIKDKFLDRDRWFKALMFKIRLRRGRIRLPSIAFHKSELLMMMLMESKGLGAIKSLLSQICQIIAL